MLGKLMKYEWKSLYKVCGIMLLSILTVTIIGCIMLSFPGAMDIFEGENISDMQPIAWTYTYIISFILYIFMLVGITYGILMYLGVHFYKTMYTDQGYLAHTLPVTPNQLYFAKTFMGALWYFIIEIAVFGSVMALILALAGSVASAEGYNLWEVLVEHLPDFKYFFTDFEKETGMSAWHYFGTMGLTVIIAPFAAVNMINSALTIGQLSRKHKAIMGILAYFGITVVNMVISMIVQMCFTISATISTMNDPYSSTANVSTTYDISLLISISMAALLYFLSHYIISHKLNME